MVGDIVDSAALVFNRSNAVTYGGIVTGSGSLAQSGTGTLTLSGTNTYTGGTFLNEGVIAIAFDHALGDPNGRLTFNGGTLRFDAQFDLPSTRPITLESGGGRIDTQSFITTISQEITGSGTLTKAGTGTLTLTGENTYSGGTTISVGTFQIGNGGTTGSIIGDVEDNGTLVFDRSGAKKTFNGVISGSGNLVKLGTDILELTANNTYSGGTIIEDGVLVAGVPSPGQATSLALGTGDLFLNGGTLRAPSLDPLTINVGRDYTQGPAGTLALGVAGIDGKDYDHVQIGGNASLNGTLAVNSLNSFRPVTGNAFEVLHTNGSRSGRFAQVNDFLNSNPNLQRFDIYAQNAVVLLYATATTPAPTPTPTPPTLGPAQPGWVFSRSFPAWALNQRSSSPRLIRRIPNP